MKLASSHTVSCFGQKGPVTVSGLEYVNITFSFSNNVINMLVPPMYLFKEIDNVYEVLLVIVF